MIKRSLSIINNLSFSFIYDAINTNNIHYDQKKNKTFWKKHTLSLSLSLSITYELNKNHTQILSIKH